MHQNISFLCSSPACCQVCHSYWPCAWCPWCRSLLSPALSASCHMDQGNPLLEGRSFPPAWQCPRWWRQSWRQGSSQCLVYCWETGQAGEIERSWTFHLSSNRWQCWWRSWRRGGSVRGKWGAHTKLAKSPWLLHARLPGKPGQYYMVSNLCSDINQALDNFTNFGFFNITFHNNVHLKWIVMDPCALAGHFVACHLSIQLYRHLKVYCVNVNL